MNALVVWMEENTTVPSVIGPYEGDLAYDDAELLRKQCHRVQVANITTPEKAKKLFANLSNLSK